MPKSLLKSLKNRRKSQFILYDDGEEKKIKWIMIPKERKQTPKAPKCTVNQKKLPNNISRAYHKIQEYAFCNKWDYFFTGTIDGKKHDRYNLSEIKAEFNQFIKNLRRKGIKVKYFIVYEPHKNGAWHFHGFLNISDKELALTRRKSKYSINVYDWLDYKNKFGGCNIEPILNKEAIEIYISKEIIDKMVNIGLNEHIYSHSKGLRTAKTIPKEKALDLIGDRGADNGYSNKYTHTLWFTISDNNQENKINGEIMGT